MNANAQPDIHIQLIRHGQASAGTDNYDRLSPTGRAQAELLGSWWRATGMRFDATYQGSLERQRDTANLALGAAGMDIEPTTIASLNEYDHNAVDDLFSRGARSADLPGALTFPDYVALMARWRDAPLKELESLESYAQFGERCWQGMGLAAAKAHATHGAASTTRPLTIGLFTSGGVIASIVTRLLQLDFEASMHAIWQIRNASVTTLHHTGERHWLVDYNTVGHLQTAADPAMITLI